MKLPIELEIEEDTIWTEYKAELSKVENVQELKAFVGRWQELLKEIKEEDLTEENLSLVKQASDPANCSFKITKTAAELTLPVKIMQAMLAAQKYIVPLNCAFIQLNGGLNAFYDDSGVTN